MKQEKTTNVALENINLGSWKKEKGFEPMTSAKPVQRYH